MRKGHKFGVVVKINRPIVSTVWRAFEIILDNGFSFRLPAFSAGLYIQKSDKILIDFEPQKMSGYLVSFWRNGHWRGDFVITEENIKQS